MKAEVKIIPKRRPGPTVELVDSTPQDKKDVINALFERGYNVLQYLGAGKTREVFLSQYNQNGVSKLRTVKIPRLEIDSDSIQAKIAFSRRNWEYRERDISNKIKHPNVVEIVDSFDLNGRTINVEPYYEGCNDLETIITTHGPMKRNFESVVDQILAGALYLEENRILHRDYKPSNMLMTGNGNVMISDLQTAAFSDKVDPSIMPTRGGSAYAHPRLLNALFSSQPACADRRTEVYSLAATFYYLLTGENAFDYSVVESETGLTLPTTEFKVKATLRYNGESIDNIGEFDHEERLKQALKKIPKEFRRYVPILHNCLSLKETNSQKSINDVSQLKEEIDKVRRKSLVERVKDSVVNGMRFVVPFAGASALIGATALLIYYSPREENPTMVELLDGKQLRDFNLNDFSGINYREKEEMAIILEEYMQDAKKRLPEIEDQIPLKTYVWKGTFRGMPTRLTHSWLRSCYLHPEAKEYYEKQHRVGEVFVPERAFMARSIQNRAGAAHSFTQFDRDHVITTGALYLKQLIAPGRNIADVYASYFAGSEDIGVAQMYGGAVEYFPYSVEDKRLAFQQRNSGRKGYGFFLSEPAKKLTNTALALYYLTDDDGNVDWNKIPRIDRHQKDYLHDYLYR